MSYMLERMLQQRRAAPPAARCNGFTPPVPQQRVAAVPVFTPWLTVPPVPRQVPSAPLFRPRFKLSPAPKPPARPAVFAMGTHVRAVSGLHGHDGIALGPQFGNQVAHLSGLESKNPRDAHVRITSIETFASERNVVAVAYNEPTFSDWEVIQRVAACLGQGGWNLFEFNCEHWCRLIKTGKAKSQQVIDWARIAGIVGVLCVFGI